MSVKIRWTKKKNVLEVRRRRQAGSRWCKAPGPDGNGRCVPGVRVRAYYSKVITDRR